MTNARAARAAIHAGSRSSSAPALAGALLLFAGVMILMGIITAEALYPDMYTTSENEISDLGATRPPDSVIHQPSATVFNVTMLVTGAAILGAAAVLRRVANPRRVWMSIGLLGLGVFGVGVFPGNYGAIHPVFALLAFTAGGAAAILSAQVQSTPFRYCSRVLGGITLGALAVGLFGEGSFVFDRIGAGGVECWIAYPTVLWLVAFGGYLQARPER